MKHAFIVIILTIAFIGTIFVPSLALVYLPSRVVMWTMSHRWASIPVIALAAIALVLYTTEYAARLELLVEKSADWADRASLAFGGIGFAVLYRWTTDQANARIHIAHLTSRMASDFAAGEQIWIILWYVLLAYVAKIPWDHLRRHAADRLRSR